jgi:hypothetical protein
VQCSVCVLRPVDHPSAAQLPFVRVLVRVRALHASLLRFHDAIGAGVCRLVRCGLNVHWGCQAIATTSQYTGVGPVRGGAAAGPVL